MVKENGMVHGLKPLGMTLLVCAFALGLSGCLPQMAAVGPNEGARLEGIVNGMDKLEADHRQMINSMSTVNSAVDASAERTRTQIEDVIKMIKQQQADLEKIKADIAMINRGTVPPPTATPTPTPVAPPVKYNTFPEAVNGGKTQLDQHQYATAGDAFQQALVMAANDREKIQANLGLGQTAFAQNDLTNAEKYFWAGIHVNNEDPDAWQCYEGVADCDRARNNNEGALQKYNQILQAWQAKGKHYLFEDRVKQKIAELQTGAAGGAAPAPGPATAPPPAGGVPGGFRM